MPSQIPQSVLPTSSQPPASIQQMLPTVSTQQHPDAAPPSAPAGYQGPYYPASSWNSTTVSQALPAPIPATTLAYQQGYYTASARPGVPPPSAQPVPVNTAGAQSNSNSTLNVSNQAQNTVSAKLPDAVAQNQFNHNLASITAKLADIIANQQSSKRLVSREDYPKLFESCWLSGHSYEMYLRNPDVVEAKERSFKSSHWESKDDQVKRFCDNNKLKATLKIDVAAHSDDAFATLHPVRFFRGPLKSAGDVFMEAATISPSLEPNPALAISAYDTSDLGIGFTIPPSLWKRLHNVMCDDFSIMDVIALRGLGEKKKLSQTDVSVDLFSWALEVFCLLSQTIR